MYLSDIEIFGFKSFANKTKFKFNDGLSAIVGPNGCGKTNVVDAIRWVLGEKKASTLRSDIMENVIFNGNKNRKPLAMAEVSITFEETQKTLNHEYDTIQISRRLYRDGASEYLINKTICKLKDILNLFMDTGIGPDTYSVIELKMIDNILSGKVDDRRAMFEEAAGIKKYKNRRKETIRKLETINQDMVRLADLLLEVRKNVNSLSRQAVKTKKYKQLLNELREAEIVALAFDFNIYNNKLNVINNQYSDIFNEKQKYEQKILQNNIQLNTLKDNIANFENNLIIINNNEIEKNNLINEKRNFIAVSNERITNFDNNLIRLNREIKESEENNFEIDKKLINDNKELNNYESRFNQLNLTKSDILRQITDSNEEINIERKKLSDANSILNTLNIKIELLDNNIKKNLEKETNLQAKISQNDEEIKSLNHQTLKIETDILLFQSNSKNIKNEIESKQENLNKAYEHKNLIENQIKNLQLKINEQKQNLNSKKATKEFLNSLIDTSETSKHLNSDNKWLQNKEKTLLGESINIDEKYSSALIASLGEIGHSFIVDTMEEALQGMNSLIKSQKGKSGFIILDNIPNINAPKPIDIDQNCFGWLSELITGDQKLINVIRGLVGKTLVVNNKETANKYLENATCDIAVTIEGELINKSGYIYGGSITQKEGQWLGKKEKLNKLEKEIKLINNNIKNFENEANELLDQLKDIDIDKLNKTLNDSQNELNELNRKISQLELKKEALENNIEMLNKMKEDLSGQLIDSINENKNIFIQIKELENDLNIAKNNSAKYDNIIKELDTKNQSINNELIKYQNQEFELQNIINNLQIQIKNNIEQINRNKKIINEKNIEIEILESTKKELVENIEQDKQLISENEISYNEILNKKQSVKEKINQLKDQHKVLDNENSLLRNNFDKVNQQIHNIDLNKIQFETSSNAILQRLSEEYQTKPEDINIPNESDYDLNEQKNLIVEIKNKLNQLGSVNFMALEEYETQNERLIFYENQMEDLTNSEKILKQTIEEINITAELKFQETFDKINENFKTLFIKLFGPESEANLQLEDNNLLESDIKITAKPPNKKPHSIEMLSGGEKTLTAIALLFAIYLVKPSPFCILDEVDAPLDDKNIDKFINMINEFSSETQFLIVTHNKKTMEAANTLYGVTMQEDGVSKVVAVKLKQNVA